MALVVAELAEDRRQLHRPLQRLDHLLHLEIALRGRKPGLLLLEEITRMHEPRRVLLVVAPLDLAALGGLGIARVAHVGRVALVAQQRKADLGFGPFEIGVGAEECERVVDRHHRQVLAGHLRDQAAPEASADHDVVGMDRAARGDDALEAPVFNDERLRRGIGERL
jgi:hypothetical protein